MTKEEKQIELIKFRKLTLATLDYYEEFYTIENIISDRDCLLWKKEIELHFKRGRLTKLKQWFRDFTEMPIETKDFKFNTYLKEKTNYDIDIFKSFYNRIDKILERGKITTNNQFYDVMSILNDVSEVNKYKKEDILKLDSIVFEFENKNIK